MPRETIVIDEHGRNRAWTLEEADAASDRILSQGELLLVISIVDNQIAAHVLEE